MVPLRDDNPVRITPYVTYGLIAVNILVFLYETTLPAPVLDAFFRTWAVVPRELSLTIEGAIIPTSPVPEWITLISSQFLHGGFWHVAGNMLFLWIFGNNVEERLGHIKYLIFYILCGILAALSQWIFAQGSTIPSLGASGAIAGVMGAYILRYPQAPIVTFIPGLFLSVRVPAYFFLGFWFAQQAFNGLASLNAPVDMGMQGGVAYWAHAGGFIFGAILGPLFGLFSEPS